MIKVLLLLPLPLYNDLVDSANMDLVEVVEKEIVVDIKRVFGSKTNTKKLPSVFVASQPDSQIICKLLLYKLIMFLTDLI